jgi:hypothetical protein
MTDALIKAGERLLRRFERCAKAHGNSDDVTADSTAEFRAALVAAQAAYPGEKAATPDMEAAYKRQCDQYRAEGFAAGIEAAAREVQQEDERLTFLADHIRALRPPAALAGTITAFDRLHGWNEPAGTPSEEDVARALCCPWVGACLRPEDCQKGKRQTEKQQIAALMALLQRSRT